MTNEFVNGVLQNYAVYGEIKKIPAYLFYGCNGQDGHDGSDPNKNVCSFTDLNIPAEFTERRLLRAYKGKRTNMQELKIEACLMGWIQI